MGDGFITRRGGGGNLKFFTSLIDVTYPEGSVCTCSNGSKTLKAKGTSGKYLFNVEPGTWTVSCTDGTDTASQSVEIASEGQTTSVELAYGFYIFKSGEGNKVELKTYKETDANLSVGSDSIELSVDSNRADDYNMFASLRTTSKIDLSKYSKLCMTCTPSSVLKTSYLGVTSTAFTKGNPEDNSATWAARTKITKSTTEKTVEVDISTVSQSLYVGFYFAGKNSIKDIWLN